MLSHDTPIISLLPITKEDRACILIEIEAKCFKHLANK